LNQKPTIITSQKNWMESSALSQLDAIARLPGATRTVGLPDLHGGKTPVGMAFATENIIYPHLIGNDIGCGMALFKTGVALGKYSEKRWVSRLNYIRELVDIEFGNPYSEESPIRDLGTLGGGNHFAEFQKVDEIFDHEEFDKIGLPSKEIALLIHCGSRGYGQRIFKALNYEIGLTDEKLTHYMNNHDDALMWAERNRIAVVEKLISWLGFNIQPNPPPVLDLCHNYIQQHGGTFIHRKGAVSSKAGIVILPGSRGSLTYLLKPADDTEISLDSLSHGAGRKWARSLCFSRIKNLYDRDTIRTTSLKSKVVCHDTNLLFQEAPEAYKNIKQVLGALVEHNLVTVVATLKPLITFKG
jgi:release factor H-coupled RctB family protein